MEDKIKKMESKIKKMESLLEKLTTLYYDSVEILETDETDASKAISIAEDCVLDEINWLKSYNKNLIDSCKNLKGVV